MTLLNIITLDIPYLLLSEHLYVHHLDLNRNQSEGLKCQAASVSVVVLDTHTKHNNFPFKYNRYCCET